LRHDEAGGQSNKHIIGVALIPFLKKQKMLGKAGNPSDKDL
jgi:hypothetical protein